MNRYHIYLHDDLVQLATAFFSLPHERKYFIDTIANNLHYQRPDIGGKKVVRVNVEQDLQRIEDLAAKVSFTFTAVNETRD